MGVTLKEATPIASVLAKPGDYVGKTIRLDGIATAVCTGNGCWMAIAQDGSPEAKSIRVKVEDGVIVIPVTAKGKKVSAEGVFEVVGDGHGQEAAAEHAKQMAQAGSGTAMKHEGEHKHETGASAEGEKTFQLKGTGIVIR
jgi:hypothetical protein